MPGFEINRVSFGLGTTTLRINGVAKGPGTTVRINGFQKDNSAITPDPISLSLAFQVDPLTACAVAQESGLQDMYIYDGVIYIRPDMAGTFNGAGRWWFSPSYSKFGACSLQIGYGGTVDNFVVCG